MHLDNSASQSSCRTWPSSSPDRVPGLSQLDHQVAEEAVVGSYQQDYEESVAENAGDKVADKEANGVSNDLTAGKL